MNLSGTEVRFGILATADPSAVNVSGSQQIGTSARALVYTDVPTVAYSMGMIIQNGDTLTLDFETGIVTGTVAGVAQVETATIVAAAGATTAGDLNVTVTSALITGSPLVIPVALTLADDTAAKVATKVRAALNTTAAVTAHYTVGGATANYSLTASAADRAVNDATLNLAHANGTSAGITTATTSTNTTAGVGTSRAYKFNGVTWNATDFEGKALPTMSKVHSVLIKSDSTPGSLTIDDGQSLAYTLPLVNQTSSPTGNHRFSESSVTFTASGAQITLTLDIHAGE